MIINHLLPVFSLIILGAVLKKFKFTDQQFFAASNRMIYFIFFPVMLFYKIAGGGGHSQIDLRFILCAASAATTIWAASLLLIVVLKIPSFQAGTFSQTSYRFNTYVGMAVIIGLLGSEGAEIFAIMIGFIIPYINFLAVSTLIWFSGKRRDQTPKIMFIAKSLCLNPLIIGCFLGIGYRACWSTIPTAIERTLNLASSVTLPLALLSIGGTLSLTQLKDNLSLSLIAGTLKFLVYPLIGFAMLKIFGISGITFKVGLIFFALPTSTAIYILSSQLWSDTKLASASIFISTILSFFSLSVVLLFIANY